MADAAAETHLAEEKCVEAEAGRRAAEGGGRERAVGGECRWEREGLPVGGVVLGTFPACPGGGEVEDDCTMASPVYVCRAVCEGVSLLGGRLFYNMPITPPPRF